MAKRTASTNKTVGKLPSKQEILDFLATASAETGKREIARAFGVKGGDRIALKALLRDMADDGLIAGSRRKLERPGALPPVTVIEIVDRDSHGEFVAKPTSWDAEHGAPPRILVIEDKRAAGPAAGIGDRVLARITALRNDSEYAYRATPIKRLARAPKGLLGIFRKLAGGGGVIDPVDRKQLKEWPVARGSTQDAKSGELVRFELSGSSRFGASAARVTECLGNPEDERATSLIAIHAHGIPDIFPEDALAEAAAARPPDLKRREDLRHLPLVTIDPADARDHDDAVFAEADPDANNKGGWVVIVAIADVAAYVRPGTALDKEARKRGNSVYFPDRVVPMLPEAISNDVCSLKESEARACIAVRMVFDKDGAKRGHRFFRGLMRSAASLAYEQAQAAIDGRLDDVTGPLLDTVLRPLWGAYGALVRARTMRGPLDLDLPERKILVNAEGRVQAVISPPRLDAHRLIEEFMIAANVAAAEALEAKRTPLIYRVHDAPSKEKIAALGEFLATLGLKIAKAGTLKPSHFNHILAATRASPNAELVGEVVLRSQAQAEYSPRQFRPFRPQSSPLRAFHLAHPPLCRPHRASGPDPRARSWRGRPHRHRDRTARIDCRSDLGDRAPRDAGGTRDGRPPDRSLPCRSDRRALPGTHLRPRPHRPICQIEGDRRRRLRAGLRDRQRILLSRRGPAGPGRRGHRGCLPTWRFRRGPIGRSDPDRGRAQVRAFERRAHDRHQAKALARSGLSG